MYTVCLGVQGSQDKGNTIPKSQSKTKAKTDKGTSVKLNPYMYSCGINVLPVLNTSFVLNVVIKVNEFMINI